ncbi:MAG: hypothetical protein ACRD3J_27020 [Thermoanaerobaculia bacterium]
MTAIQTEMARTSGGSPVALLDRMLSAFSASIQATLKTGGTS